jgi:hypothetical protein
MMICNGCGERMDGDGYTQAFHCPSLVVCDVEPDANPRHCEPTLPLIEVRELTKREWYDALNALVPRKRTFERR